MIKTNSVSADWIKGFFLPIHFQHFYLQTKAKRPKIWAPFSLFRHVLYVILLVCGCRSLIYYYFYATQPLHNIYIFIHKSSILSKYQTCSWIFFFLDISRPVITISENQPLLIGTVSHIQCMVNTTLVITMKLDCFNSVSNTSRRHQGHSVIEVDALIDYQRVDNCSCSVSYRDFTKNVFIEVLTTGTYGASYEV